MNVLMLGSGKGAWQIRGVQLGAAIGARVRTEPTREDVLWADRVVLIKRALAIWGLQVRRWTSVPIVWDALDFWQQPLQNGLDQDSAIRMAQDYMRPVGPDLVIGATQQMADDLCGIYLPHHTNPQIEWKLVRRSIAMVAYEGGQVYLGRWQRCLMKECEKRSWQFVINPSSLADADIVVAFRDGDWNGWMCRAWKSGVKAVNALAAGRPFVSQDSSSRREIQPPGSVVEMAKKSSAAFDEWADYDSRVQAFHRAVGMADSYRLPVVAKTYLEALERVSCAA